MTNSVGVSNAIGGNLTKDGTEKGEKAGEWSFEFSQAEKSVQLKIHLDNGEGIVIGPCQSSMGSKLEKGDVNQLIQWLYAVKCNME
jgi:hypothetical protein